MAITFFISCVCISCANCQAVAAGSEPPPAAIVPPQPAHYEEVRSLLGGFEFKSSRRKLIDIGERAFPVYQRLLANPETDKGVTARIFEVLSNVQGKKQDFLDATVAALLHEDEFVRIKAVNFLSHIGGPDSAAPVVALLADRERTVVNNAASTLVSIGDKWTLAAIDVWLKSGNHPDDKSLRRYVAECREKLKQRLDKAKQPGK